MVFFFSLILKYLTPVEKNAQTKNKQTTKTYTRKTTLNKTKNKFPNDGWCFWHSTTIMSGLFRCCISDVYLPDVIFDLCVMWEIIERCAVVHSFCSLSFENNESETVCQGGCCCLVVLSGVIYSSEVQITVCDDITTCLWMLDDSCLRGEEAGATNKQTKQTSVNFCLSSVSHLSPWRKWL